MTETVKHTPWAVSPHPWPEQVGCCPLVGRPYSVHGTDSRNVAAANTLDIARLISAAPDMLEALRDIKNDSIIKSVMKSPLWHKLTSAIERAEGREP